jgi:cytochrome P450
MLEILLQAVIYEGLRILPAFTALVPKEVPPGGDTLHGKFVPEGTNICANVWGMLRRKEIYGQDADMFRPERFLVDQEQRQRMERNTELVFSYGRWSCAGKIVAFLELNKALVQVKSHQFPWCITNFTD